MFSLSVSASDRLKGVVERRKWVTGGGYRMTAAWPLFIQLRRSRRLHDTAASCQNRTLGCGDSVYSDQHLRRDRSALLYAPLDSGISRCSSSPCAAKGEYWRAVDTAMVMNPSHLPRAVVEPYGCTRANGPCRTAWPGSRAHQPAARALALFRRERLWSEGWGAACP